MSYTPSRYMINATGPQPVPKAETQIIPFFEFFAVTACSIPFNCRATKQPLGHHANSSGSGSHLTMMDGDFPRKGCVKMLPREQGGFP